MSASYWGQLRSRADWSVFILPDVLALLFRFWCWFDELMLINRRAWIFPTFCFVIWIWLIFILWCHKCNKNPWVLSPYELKIRRSLPSAILASREDSGVSLRSNVSLWKMLVESPPPAQTLGVSRMAWVFGKWKSNEILGHDGYGFTKSFILIHGFQEEIFRIRRP